MSEKQQTIDKQKTQASPYIRCQPGLRRRCFCFDRRGVLLPQASRFFSGRPAGRSAIHIYQYRNPAYCTWRLYVDTGGHCHKARRRDKGKSTCYKRDFCLGT